MLRKVESILSQLLKNSPKYEVKVECINEIFFVVILCKDFDFFKLHAQKIKDFLTSQLGVELCLGVQNESGKYIMF